DPPQDFALDQGLADQAKLVIFEIAQPAMHELGRPRRRPARQVIHFTEKNRVSAARRIARDAAAIHSASDNGEVVNPVQRTLPRQSPFSLWRLSFRFGVEHNEKRKQAKVGIWGRATLSCPAKAGHPVRRVVDWRAERPPRSTGIVRSSQAMTNHTLRSAGGAGSGALSS